MCRFVPESTRWLLVKEKYEKAEKGIQYIAAVNKCEIPSELNIREIDKVSYMQHE